MRYFLTGALLLFIFLPGLLRAQDSSHVKWTVMVEKAEGNEVTLRFSGKIRQGWHIYATPNESQGTSGPVVSFTDTPELAAPIELITKPVALQDTVFDNSPMQILRDSAVFDQTFRFSSLPPMVELKLNYEAADSKNFVPEEFSYMVVLSKDAQLKSANRILIPSIGPQKTITDCTTSGEVSGEAASSGLLNIFLLGFIGGLVALLTPCVFPMIPLTVSFFTKKAGTRKEGIRNATIYGFFIFLIYVLLSMPFHFLDSLDPEILNNISTNVWLNVFFFLIFIIFAFSFFGYYEITLPAALSGSADSKAGTGNLAGIFFMALTLSLVSFSCTGPILGSLLAGSLTGDGGAMQLTSGMAGFGLALALPFALFALFPNWLQSLPRSGGWLNTVKVFLGFVELALAFKFLSNADLVKHWGLLKREVFIGIWIILGFLTSAYLFGILRFKHDQAGAKLSWGRKITGVIILLFTFYLLPGVTNTKWANLTLISGFPPPLYYSVYQKNSECVLDLNCTRDYEEGLARAIKENKPLLIDFTGYACVNCRRMEENIWSKQDVYNIMKEEFIVVSLYVDDKKMLPAEQRFTYKTKDGNSKSIRTVGDKWSTFQTENFANNSQPWYAIVDTRERLLTKPVGYTPEAGEYLDWLRCGLNAFNGKK